MGKLLTFPNRACKPTQVAVFDDSDQLKTLAALIEQTRQELPAIAAAFDVSAYVFTERPAAKSSTNVAAGSTVCRTCGCKKGGADAGQRAAQEIAARKNCDCVCHGGLK